MPKWKHTQAMSAASFPAAQDLNWDARDLAEAWVAAKTACSSRSIERLLHNGSMHRVCGIL